jgi:hypothetical protein
VTMVSSHSLALLAAQDTPRVAFDVGLVSEYLIALLHAAPLWSGS